MKFKLAVLVVVGYCLPVSLNAQANAYDIAKKMIKFENAAMNKDSEQNLSKDDLEEFFAIIIWYGNLQDTAIERQLRRFREELPAYPRLSTLYNRVLMRVYSLDFLNTESEEQFKKKYPVLNGRDEMKTFTRALKVLWMLNDSINSKKLELNKESRRRSSYKTSIDSVNFKLARAEADSAKLLAEKNLIRDQIDSVDKLVNRRQYLLDTLIQRRRAELITLEESFRNAQTGSELHNALEALAGLKIKWKPLFSPDEPRENPKLSAMIEEKEKQAVKMEQSAVSFKWPSETEMINQLAIYLAKRVRQEAVMWFFETIKINADRYNLISSFFPNTITLLQSSEIYEIPNLGTQWRYALAKDFVKMPRSVLDSDWFRDWMKKKGDRAEDNDVINFIKTMYDVCDLLSQQYTYQELVKQMYLNLQSSKSSSKFVITPSDIFTILYAINQECFVASKDSSSRYRLLRYEDFRNLSRDELDIMVSLMDMKYGKVFRKIWGATTANDYFLDAADDPEAFRLWIGRIESGIQQFNKMQVEFSQFTEAVKKGHQVDAAYSVSNMWDNISKIVGLIIPDDQVKNQKLAVLAEKSKYFRKIMDGAFDVYHQLSLKNYAGAVNKSISLVEDLLYGADSTFVMTDLSRIREQRDTNFIARYIGVNAKQLRFRQQSYQSSFVFEKERHAINLVRKLAGFLNDVMLTKESSDLAKVVESYALPPGSYKRKRNSWWSIDLNGYVGGYAGLERIGASGQKYGGVYGITAPIGLSLTHTFGSKLDTSKMLTEDLIRNPDKIFIGKKYIRQRKKLSISIAVNVIDLGAVVSYRFTNADAISKGLPREVNWGQILSPGVKLGVGIPGTPLMAALGWQFTPKLRSLEDDPANEFSTHRFFTALLFDMPLANLFQKSYRTR
jgi:hypothetical protein